MSKCIVRQLKQLVGPGDNNFWENMNFLPMEEKLKEDLNRLIQRSR